MAMTVAAMYGAYPAARLDTRCIRCKRQPCRRGNIGRDESDLQLPMQECGTNTPQAAA